MSRGRWVAQILKRNEQLITGWGEDEIKSFFKLDIPLFYYQATSTVLMTEVMGKNTTDFLSALLSSWPHGREGCLCSVFCGRCNKVAKTGWVETTAILSQSSGKAVVGNQGVSSILLQLQAIGENPLFASSSFHWLQAFLSLGLC